MDWQLAIVLVVIAAALLYLARRTWRTWAGAKGGCGGTCGCAGGKADGKSVSLIPPEQLTLRRRGGQDQ
jgi:hypothetical protein